MGNAIYIKIKKSDKLNIEKACNELFAWVNAHGGYDNNYYEWRAVNHMNVISLEDAFCKEQPEVNQYWHTIFKSEKIQTDELLFNHHDMPWGYQLSPEFRAKAKECFEKYNVLNVWWLILKQLREGMNLVDKLFPKIEKLERCNENANQ